MKREKLIEKDKIIIHFFTRGLPDLFLIRMLRVKKSKLRIQEIYNGFEHRIFITSFLCGEILKVLKIRYLRFVHFFISDR